MQIFAASARRVYKSSRQHVSSPAPENQTHTRRPRWLRVVLVVVAAALVAGAFVKVRATYFPLQAPFVFDPSKPFTLEYNETRIPNHINPGDKRTIAAIDQSGSVRLWMYRGVSREHLDSVTSASLKDFKSQAGFTRLQLSPQQRIDIASMLQRDNIAGAKTSVQHDGSDIMKVVVFRIRQGRSQSFVMRLDDKLGADFFKIFDYRCPPNTLGESVISPDQFLQKWAPIQAEIDDAFEAEQQRIHSRVFWSKLRSQTSKLFLP